jgi:hypothetical protein
VRRSALLKVLFALAALAVFAVLFIRSVKNVSAQPYTMDRTQLTGWTIGLDPAPDTSGVVLALVPPRSLAPPLFSQIFSRSGLTLSGPDTVEMPLVLKAEFDRAQMSRTLPPETLEQLARESAVASTPPTPTCLATRRISQPRSTRQVFFVRFDFPPFAALRRMIAARLGSGVAFDPGGLSPIVITAATDADFASWLPLQGGAQQDCVAPITLQ